MPAKPTLLRIFAFLAVLATPFLAIGLDRWEEAVKREMFSSLEPQSVAGYVFIANILFVGSWMFLIGLVALRRERDTPLAIVAVVVGLVITFLFLFSFSPLWDFPPLQFLKEIPFRGYRGVIMQYGFTSRTTLSALWLIAVGFVGLRKRA